MKETNNYGAGVPWLLILTIIFGTLKVAGILDISWLVVFFPMLFTAGLVIIVLMILIIYQIIKIMLDK